MYCTDVIYVVEPKSNGRTCITKLRKTVIDIDAKDENKIKYNITSANGKTIVKDGISTQQSIINLLERRNDFNE